MRDLIVATIVFGLLPFILKRPFWGVLLSTWLGYMNPHRLCYGFMYTMPVVYIVAITTLLGMLFSREAKRIVWSREIIVLVLFIAWMGITTTQAIYLEPAWDQYIKVLKIQVLTFMALMLLTSRERVHMFVVAIALSLAFYGLKGGIFTVIHGGVYRVQGPDGTFIGGNNELALALVMTIPLLRYLQLQETKRIRKLGLAALMILSAIAAVGSQSRGALVGLSLMGVMFWLKSRNRFFTAALIALSTVVIASLMPEQWYQRMDTIDSYQQDDSALGRINAWGMAWNMAKHRFFGGGFDSFREGTFALYAPDPTNVHDSHSIYFGTLGHHGFIGLALFLTLLALTWRKCSATIRFAKNRPELTWARDLSAMMQVTLIGYMSAGAFLGLMYFDYLYHLIALSVVVNDMVRRSTPVEVNKASPPTPSTHKVLAHPARTVVQGSTVR